MFSPNAKGGAIHYSNKMNGAEKQGKTPANKNFQRFLSYIANKPPSQPASNKTSLVTPGAPVVNVSNRLTAWKNQFVHQPSLHAQASSIENLSVSLMNLT